MSYGRYNPRISFDQYVHLLKLNMKRERDEVERGALQQLVRQWGIPQSTLSTAVHRGIKCYDYKLRKSGVQP